MFLQLLNTVEEEDMDVGMPESGSDDEEEEELPTKSRKQTMAYTRHDKGDPLLAESGSEGDASESDDDGEMEMESE